MEREDKPTKPRNILVTGCAGFIGYHVARRYLKEGRQVVGLDNLNEYYDVNLKRARLAGLGSFTGFRFVLADIADHSRIDRLFQEEQFDLIIHMAAQAGVRYSLTHPESYVQSNLVGFGNLLEACRQNHIQHLVFASSSSVYGANKLMPFSVHHNVDQPLSLYAATKKADELMAHAYAHLYWLPTTGLRFFTVYGPWCRPDMALFLFTKKILEDRPIEVFNYGRMRRDFTYIDDIVEGVVRVAERIPQANPAWNAQSNDPAASQAPYRIHNIGSGSPADLSEAIQILEERLGRKAQRILLPLQPGDVEATFAYISDLELETGFRPKTSLREGITRFVDWYLDFQSFAQSSVDRVDEDVFRLSVSSGPHSKEEFGGGSDEWKGK
jgi:UDP-glucuronate 4-epimerase